VNIYLKLLLAEAFSAQNAPNSVWRPARLSPDPLGELTALPQAPSWIKGSLLLREGDGTGVEVGEKTGREV